MSITTLTDDPPIKVPAKPWTNVTNNDNAVSHLISVYFTLHNASYPTVDQDVFTREMNRKDLSSSFCSQFLVTSMLLVASVSSPSASRFC